jgi:acyl-CoA synthetase (NDP forming)
MRSLLQPRSIALGCLRQPPQAFRETGRLLEAFRLPGEHLPDQRQGIAAYASLDEVPGVVDLVMIMVPAEQVPEAVRVCGACGVGAAIVGASGFAETGEAGARLQAELRAAIDETRVRVLDG